MSELSKVGNNPDPVKDSLDMKIAELTAALNASVPGYAGLLKDIHKLVLNNPTQATLLSEDQIRAVVNGYEKYSNVQLASLSESKSPKSATAAAKKLAKTITIDDI
jgi:small nuclear ribonucleoprotein (snRNP)-like protein